MGGRFERTSEENYEELLKLLDVNFLLRKAATVSTPTVEITETDGVFNIKSSTTMKTVEMSFKEGMLSTTSVREMTTPDELTYTTTVDGKDLVCVQNTRDCSLTTTTLCVLCEAGLNTIQVLGPILTPAILW